MFSGIFAGITWALETVILGIALSMTPFISTKESMLLAPFISTFIHDTASALYMLIYNGLKGKIKEIFKILKTKNGKWLILASLIGGPIGMTGYVLAVNYLGSAIGAVASAIYPAIGTLLAYLFLKEKIKWYQWIFLVFTLIGVFGLSYSPDFYIKNFWLGLCGAFMCAFGWGIEGVILSKCLKNTEIKTEYALHIRQTSSALFYGLILIPILKGWGITSSLFLKENVYVLCIIALAALCATVSYLFYYRAISLVGVSKAMGLNITYTAWAILFTAAISRDFNGFNIFTLACVVVVVLCGIFAATDFKEIFRRRE